MVLTLAHYLTAGPIDRHLRAAARSYRQCVAELVDQLERHFPVGRKISAPQGGFLVRVELPRAVDTDALLEDSLRRGISFAPGTLFAPTNGFENFMRLNAVVAWNGRAKTAIQTLGDLVCA